MAENAVQSVQSLIQDVLAPDLRELKVKVDALDKRSDSFEKHISELFASFQRQIDERFAAAKDQSDANLRLVLGAIARLELLNENSGLRAVADIRERVAILEARAA